MSGSDKELSSKLSEIDKAYLAGLFDGEGCISPIWGSKKYFLTKEHKEKTSHYPRLQFVITNKNNVLLDLIKEKMGNFGNVYRGKNGVAYDYRISAEKEVLNVVNALIPYVKLKKEPLYVSKDALIYQLKRKLHARWTKEEKTFFHENFMSKLQKLLPSGEKRGRPSKYSLKDILSS
jgi:hypothetical protein